MKKLMEIMAEELSSAFEKAGYDPEYGKVTVSNLSLIHILERKKSPARRDHI